MRVAFVVPARNKAAYAAEAVRSVLAQRFSPMEIIFSDQGSTDETLKILEEEARGYNGPNKVRVVSCPEVPPMGMAGFNTHLSWLVKQTDADVILVNSADDLVDPARADCVVDAYRKTGASSVGTAMFFKDPRNPEDITRSAFPDRTGFVEAGMIVTHKIGGSASLSFARDLFEKYGPFTDDTCTDVAIPFFGALERGHWFIRDELQTYVKHANPDNMGLEGRYASAQTEVEQKLLEELMFYQVTTSLCRIGRKADAMGKLTPQAMQGLGAAVIGQANGWSMVRDWLANHDIQPLVKP